MTDDRDPGDEDRRPVGTHARHDQIDNELAALEDDATTPAIQAFIRKLMEGKLK